MLVWWIGKYGSAQLLPVSVHAPPVARHAALQPVGGSAAG